MNFPQGYPPHNRPPYGHYPTQNVKKNETGEEKSTSGSNTAASANEKQVKEEERPLPEPAPGTTLVFKTPTKTNTVPKLPMKAPTKPSSEKESVVDAAAKAEAEKKAKAKENIQPKDSQIPVEKPKGPAAGKAMTNPQKPVPMPPGPYHHPSYPYPGFLPPHMMHMYPPPYAMPNITKRPKKKPVAPTVAAAPQAPAKEVKTEKVPSTNTTSAAVEKAKAPSAMNVKRLTSGPKFANPGSGRKSSKWTREEVSTLARLVQFTSYLTLNMFTYFNPHRMISFAAPSKSTEPKIGSQSVRVFLIEPKLNAFTAGKKSSNHPWSKDHGPPKKTAPSKNMSASMEPANGPRLPKFSPVE